jgi:hypothetical protein
VPYIDVQLYNKNENNIARFPIIIKEGREHKNRNWSTRTEAMYFLKNSFTKHGLRNGTDYLFLDKNDRDNISVLFAEESNTSFFTMLYECQKNR